MLGIEHQGDEDLVLEIAKFGLQVVANDLRRSECRPRRTRRPST
jgi:hypothetical protein